MYVFIEFLSIHSTIGLQEREAVPVVLPPDGSCDSDKGTSKEDEDALYTKGQCEDAKRSGDHCIDRSTDEGANQSKQRDVSGNN